MGRSLGARILIALACAYFPPLLAAQPVPAPWTPVDVGAAAVQGSASFAGDTVSISAAGSGLSGKSDQFMFVYQPIAGDGVIVARVDGLQGTSEHAQAGVMIRESLAPDSRHAFVELSGGDRVAFHQRELTGRLTTHTLGRANAAPVWLKLERRASALEAFRSSDGVTWSSIGATVIAMSSTAFVGLAVASHDVDTLTTAMFSNVSVTALTDPPGRLPIGWSSTDVGTPLRQGGATYRTGTFAVTGGGIDIGGSADQFHFVYTRVTGDIEISARVAAVEAVVAWTKAGVMLRDALTANATHASLLLTRARGVAFERRPVAGGASRHTTVGSGRAPRWVKLRRRGELVTAYLSIDGRRWIRTGTATLTLPTIYVGLAVTSHFPTRTATALFDHVVVRRPNEPPSISLTAPADHATFVAPATVALAAAPDDADGAIARVDFFAGTAWIGSSAAPPYTATWTGVPAGTYPLRAVAWDNERAVAISTVRSILVTSPYRAVFVPSTNHDSAVTHYVLDIFTAGGDPGTETPIESISIGKPEVIDGECSADVTTTVTSLPPGMFIATVTAVGPGGSTRSDVSPPFAR